MPLGPTDCFRRFQELLVQHSIQAPPAQLGVFRVSDAKLLTDFASTTLFKHFLLYQFCVNVEQEVQTLRFCRPLQRPLPCPDLTGVRVKPRRKSVEAAGSPGGNQGDAGKAEAAGSAAEGGSPEEDEVDLLVAEKLRETEEKLQAKLDEREAAFRQKLAERTA